jgi:hypothetical protein
VRRNKSSVATSGHSTNTPNIGSQPFSVGRWSNYDLSGSLNTAFAGDIGELIVYNSALSTSSGGDMERIENYLSSKWGV